VKPDRSQSSGGDVKEPEGSADLFSQYQSCQVLKEDASENERQDGANPAL